MSKSDAQPYADTADFVENHNFERTLATVEALATLRHEYETLRLQVVMRGGKYGHIYEGMACILCGHDGPIDEPELCDAEQRFAEVRERLRKTSRVLNQLHTWAEAKQAEAQQATDEGDS